MKMKNAAQQMSDILLLRTGEMLKPEQIIKKVANAKQKIKLKADMKKTGNLPIELKPSEELLLDILHAEDNPAISEIKTGLEIGVKVAKKMKHLMMMSQSLLILMKTLLIRLL